MHPIVDLRSDTVTKPTAAMREAMLAAEVGDNVFGEDPTIRALEARGAALLGKEAALYVVSGTMANALSIRLTCTPGDELILEEGAHPHHYEGGGPPAFSGVTIRTVPSTHGIMDPADVIAALHPGDYYRPCQRGIAVENTSNRGGGTVYPMETVRAIAAIARSRDLRMHLDGARLWNAHVATGIPMATLSAPFDTVSVCFSKGLGAPVGSLLAGSKADIERAWHFRHMLGGSWRQAGILAAGALHAMDHHVARLAEDHGNAARLAAGLAAMGVEVTNPVETNMVYFRHADPEGLVARMAPHGVRMGLPKPGFIRAVTHLDVDAAGIERALEVVGKVA
ncbi:MAG: GntG family PLP-dependent aldolase [Pseudomonadota bacterium]